MGQAQSEVAASAAVAAEDQSHAQQQQQQQHPSLSSSFVAAALPQNSEQQQPSSSSSSSSMDSLLAEAAAYGSSSIRNSNDNENDNEESPEAMARKALECPCIADLRNGTCGAQFSDAFLCFLKSTADDKGSDCVHPFVALQNCITANPDAFSRDVLAQGEEEEEEAATEEEPAQEYKIIPPIWSREPSSPKSKL